MAVPGRLTPPLLGLRDDIADVGACEYGNDVRTLCERGSVGSDRVVVLFGDSHARHWIPALDLVAKREGFAAYYLVKPGCGAVQVVVDAAAESGRERYEQCLAWRRWAIDRIDRLQPDVTILSSDMTPGEIGFVSQTTQIEAAVADQIWTGLHQAVSAVKAVSGRVVVMGDVPGFAVQPGSCLAARGATLAGCASTPNQLWASGLSITRDVARSDHVGFVNPVRWFCADDLCPAVVGSTITYRDMGHISASYSATLAAALGDALDLSATPRLGER
jgi:hypothetical protein